MVHPCRAHSWFLAPLTGEEKDQIAAYLSSLAKLPGQAEADAKAKADGTLGKGEALFADNCAGCHEEGAGGGPDLTNYGSAEWLELMIRNPNHEKMYAYDGDEHNDRMPAFDKLLTDKQIQMIVRWLRSDDLVLKKPEAETETKTDAAPKADADAKADADPKAED